MIDTQFILQMEQKGLLTRTFRRLDPQRQQSVIQAIIDEATEKGPAAINIKVVAEKAGVSVGSLYQYFGGRDTLLNFAVHMVTHIITTSFEQYRPYLASVPLEQGLMEYLLGGIEWSRDYAGFMRFFARAAYMGNEELQEPLVRPIAEVMKKIIADMLTQAVARGEIRSDIDIEALSHIIHAFTIALGDPVLLPYLNTYFQLTDDTLPPERVFQTAIKMILNGIANPDNAPSE